MKCKNHPDEEVMAVCQKFNVGYCTKCCEEQNYDTNVKQCVCTSPNVHCSFRQQCIVYSLSRKRSRELKEKQKQDI
jgi:hypothetical protein